MAESMHHRGPDDRGTFFDDAAGIALAHNRLSIIDLSASGRQPMSNEDGFVQLVFNGEIYNFSELRAELVAAGHHFISRTDSEVIVHGYEAESENLVQRLCGMFAFAIWDSKQRSLFLARDPMGIKPLYYWWSDAGVFYFSSEIKAFLVLDEFHPRLNQRALSQYLEFNFIADVNETSLEGVYKLPAGHWLKIRFEDVQSGRRPEPQRYFHEPAVEPIQEAESDLDQRADRLLAVFEQVVNEHLVADVKVGLLLSGGLDSSLIAAVASRQNTIRTLTMGFAASGLDERPFGREVSNFLGTDHEEALIDSSEIAENLSESVRFVDDLFGDWGVITTRLLYQRCRNAGLKVILVGEGSDELFGGYPNYVRVGQDGDGLGLVGRALRMYRWYSGRRWGGQFWTLYRLYRDLERHTNGDAFSAVRLFETRHQLPHCYNMKVDKASMSTSVEARVPFLDVRVAREGFSTPREFLLRDGTNKFLLRHMARRHRLLPEELISRKKVGGSIAANWMDDIPGFRSFAREVIFDRDGLTQTLGLERPMRAYFDGERRGYAFPHPLSIFSIVAWRMLLLNLWSRHYLRPSLARAA